MVGSPRDVRRTYDRIADHFAATRREPWPEVGEFLADTDHVSTALDIGCGNGRHVPDLLDLADNVLGVDISKALLAIAAAEVNHPRLHLLQAEACELPLQSGSVDVLLCIATLHHLPTTTERLRALNEINRVLAREGQGLISVWSVSHERFDRETGHDRRVPWTLPSGEVVDRFYHIYDLDEFTRELDRSRLTVLRTFESQGNCYGVTSSQA